MYRLFALVAVLSVAALVSGSAVADDKDKDKPKDIGEIMKKAHKGDEAFITVLKAAVKDKDFEKAAPVAKAWNALAPHLVSFDPPKGEKASWKKLCETYAKQVKSLAAAVDKKDAKAAGAALGALGKGCGGCHKVHK